MMFAKVLVVRISLAVCLLYAGVSYGVTNDEIAQLVNQGQYESALTAVETALSERGSQNELLLVKGFLFIQLGQLKNAEALYVDLAKVLPESAEVSNNLGVVYQLQNRLDQAVGQFQGTLQRFPDFIRAYENLGDTYMRMAQQAYAEGTNAAPDDAVLISKSQLGLQFHAIAKQNIRPQTQPTEVQPQETQEAVVTETPAAQPTTTEEQLIAFLESWILGWSSKDPEAYFSHYSREFTPKDQPTLDAWIERKRRIIDNAEFINVSLNDIDFNATSENTITVSFTQNYQSNTYEGTSPKQLDLKNYDGRWFIIAER